MVRGWLERGVDGFRLDVFNAFFKDEQLLSNPRRYRGRRPYDRQVHLYDKDRPELAGFLAEFRALVDSFPERMTVGELFSGDPALAPKLSAPKPSRLRLRADPPALGRRGVRGRQPEARGALRRPTPGRPSCSRTTTNRARRRGSPRAPMPRPATRSPAPRPSCSLTMRGTPFLYYGEEIGARDVPVPWSEIIDPPAKRGGRLVRRLVPWWNRDQARSPMPWGGGGPNGGFSTAQPWLRMAPDVETRNVAHPGRRSVGRSWRRTARCVWLRRTLSGAPGRTLSAAAGRRRATCTPSSARRPTNRSSWRSTSASKATRVARPDAPPLDRAVRHARAARPPSCVGDDQLTLAPREAIILLAT